MWKQKIIISSYESTTNTTLKAFYNCEFCYSKNCRNCDLTATVGAFFYNKEQVLKEELKKRRF